MSAVIDCLEFLPGGNFRRWLLVHHPGALLKEAEFTWTRMLDEATRFDDERADRLKATAAELPWLPTDPPKVPMTLRVVHGHYEEPTLPAMKPAPEIVAEREHRHRDREAALAASVHRHVEPDEAYRETCRRLGEHD